MAGQSRSSYGSFMFGGMVFSDQPLPPPTQHTALVLSWIASQ